MIDKGHNEMQDLLREGAAALKDMRKGIENACVELREIYGKTLLRDNKKANLTSKEKSHRKQGNQRNNIAYT
jgi:hypothetical protein